MPSSEAFFWQTFVHLANALPALIFADKNTSLLPLATTTAIADLLDTSDSALAGILIIPSMPGFILYVLITGDIHRWQPGPIGQAGRIIVTTLGPWLFWTPLVYWLYKRLKA